MIPEESAQLMCKNGISSVKNRPAIRLVSTRDAIKKPERMSKVC